MPSVFEGLRVVDLSEGMAGAMAAMVLADYGADVIKVRSPAGEIGRSRPGSHMWNRGKISIAIDLTLASDIEAVTSLAAASDVVIEDVGQRNLPQMLRYDSLKNVCPKVLYCSLSTFDILGLDSVGVTEEMVAARSGRYLGLDALSGAAVTDAAKRPVFVAYPIGSYSAAMLAVTAVCGMLLRRSRQGVGMHASTSILDGLIAATMRMGYARREDRVLLSAQSVPAVLMRGIALTFMTAECSDGRYIQMCARQDQHFRNWLRATGLDYIVEDPRYAGAPLSFENVEDIIEVESLLRKAMKRHPQQHWMELFTNEYDVGADPVLSGAEFMRHPQMVLNDHVVTLESPEVGTTLQIGAIAHLSKSGSTIGAPTSTLRSAQPWTIEKATNAEAERREREPAAQALSGGPSGPIFAGTTIVELATFLAAPLGTAVLAEQGARVIKIEPLEGDPFRRVGLEFAQLSHGKESIAINLKDARGTEILHRLVARADVLLHNLRPGVPERLGADYGALSKVNSQLIYVYAGSYGSRGPQSHRPAFHSTPHALSGAAIWQAGRGNAPVDDSYPDPCAGLAVGVAIGLGLVARERQGFGQYIETSMLCSTGYVQSDQLIEYPDRDPLLTVDTYQTGFHALYRLYECKKGWIFVGVRTEQERRRLAAVMAEAGNPLPSLFEGELGRDEDEQHASLLQAAFLEREAVSWVERFREGGVPAVIADAEHFEEFLLRNGLLEPVTHPGFGDYFRPRPRVRSPHATSVRGDACTLGQHSEAVLSDLGYSYEEQQALVRNGVIGVHATT